MTGVKIYCVPVDFSIQRSKCLFHHLKFWSRLRITFCLRYIASYFVLILVLAAAGFSNAMYMKKLFFHSLLLLFHSFSLFACFILQQVSNKRYKDNISWQVHEEVTNIVPPVSLFDIFLINHCGFDNLVSMNYSPITRGRGNSLATSLNL